jgi:hypothetical protein
LESIIKIDNKIKLNAPILVEGLPGIGFVANISTTHLIEGLKAEKFGELASPYFQDLAITAEDGAFRHPTNEFYYWQSPKGDRDLIILHGNTQALTVYGQYELCGKILSLAQEMSCKLIISIGGLKKERVPHPPRLYCTATDSDALSEIRSYGLDVIQGHIYGVAGLLMGLARLRGMKGFCILAETLGTYPDTAAAKAVLELLNNVLGLEVNLERLEEAAEETSRALSSFGLVETKREREFFGSV